MLWRHEHICQQMLLAPGKNQVDVGYNLDDGTDEGISSYIAVVANLLKLVNGKETRLFRCFHIVEYLLECFMGVAGFNCKAERWRTAKGIDTHRWPQSGNELVEFPLDRLRRGIELAYDSVGDELHHLAEGLCREDVHVKALWVLKKIQPPISRRLDSF